MSPRVLGFLFVLSAGVLWGFSGAVADILFHRYGVTPMWLAQVRLLSSGILLFLALAVWRPLSLRLERKDLLATVVFGTVGFFLVQYSYFAAIADTGVAIATFLQYLGPAMIVLYTVFRLRRLPSAHELGAVALSIGGTWLLVSASPSHGISLQGLLWGIAAALSLAFYTIYPARLVGRLGPWATSCYAFLFGGLTATILSPFVAAPVAHLTAAVIALVAFVVLFGTLLPFSFYMAAVARLRSAEVGIGATTEPLAAALAAALLLGQRLGAGQYLGGVLIVIAVGLLAAVSRGRMRAGGMEDST